MECVVGNRHIDVAEVLGEELRVQAGEPNTVWLRHPEDKQTDTHNFQPRTPAGRHDYAFKQAQTGR